MSSLDIALRPAHYTLEILYIIIRIIYSISLIRESGFLEIGSSVMGYLREVRGCAIVVVVGVFLRIRLLYDLCGWNFLVLSD